MLKYVLLYMCEVLNRTGVYMYSKEFMKFLYGYQKEDFKPKNPEKREIRFKNNRGGKLAEVFVTENNK